jgi:hypothetical protein
MQHVHADLVAQVMHELAELYRDDEVTLAEQFICLQLLLERTGTVPQGEKRKIKERLSMFDQLWEESPMIQKMREQYRVQGIQEGILEGLQRFLVNTVQTDYPDLAEVVQQQASKFNKPDMLELLIKQVMSAPDSDAVRRLLEAGTTIQS